MFFLTNQPFISSPPNAESGSEYITLGLPIAATILSSASLQSFPAFSVIGSTCIFFVKLSIAITAYGGLSAATVLMSSLSTR